jgi:hypothetical protein
MIAGMLLSMKSSICPFEKWFVFLAGSFFSDLRSQPFHLYSDSISLQQIQPDTQNHAMHYFFRRFIGSDKVLLEAVFRFLADYCFPEAGL